MYLLVVYLGLENVQLAGTEGSASPRSALFCQLFAMTVVFVSSGQVQWLQEDLWGGVSLSSYSCRNGLYIDHRIVLKPSHFLGFEAVL